MTDEKDNVFFLDPDQKQYEKLNKLLYKKETELFLYVQAKNNFDDSGNVTVRYELNIDGVLHFMERFFVPRAKMYVRDVFGLKFAKWVFDDYTIEAKEESSI